MNRILHVSCSPRGAAAESYRLARRIIELLQLREPTAILTRREIGDGAMAHIDDGYASAQASLRDDATGASMARSEALIQELEQSDVIVIGTPMHNLSAPSTLKAWIDHVVRAGRTFEIGRSGKTGLLRDRPVFIAIASGGRFSGERPTQPDFLSPYLETILGTIGLRDLRFFSVQGTGAAPDAVAEARARTERELQAHFARFVPPSAAIGERP